MSLVGSLQDLGLGDILQIVSLSRKSGLLLLRSDSGEGRIVLRDGQVCAAFVKGEPEDLRGLLLIGGFVEESEFELAVEANRRRGVPLVEAVLGITSLTNESLERLCRRYPRIGARIYSNLNEVVASRLVSLTSRVAL